MTTANFHNLVPWASNPSDNVLRFGLLIERSPETGALASNLPIMGGDAGLPVVPVWYEDTPSRFLIALSVVHLWVGTPTVEASELVLSLSPAMRQRLITGFWEMSTLLDDGNRVSAIECRMARRFEMDFLQPRSIDQDVLSISAEDITKALTGYLHQVLR